MLAATETTATVAAAITATHLDHIFADRRLPIRRGRSAIRWISTFNEADCVQTSGLIGSVAILRTPSTSICWLAGSSSSNRAKPSQLVLIESINAQRPLTSSGGLAGDGYVVGQRADSIKGADTTTAHGGCSWLLAESRRCHNSMATDTGMLQLQPSSQQLQQQRRLTTILLINALDGT